MSTDPAEIEEWLHQLESSLASMSSPERDNILEEARSHLRESLAAGCTPSAALARFGSAEDYAQRFVDEMPIYFGRRVDLSDSTKKLLLRVVWAVIIVLVLLAVISRYLPSLPAHQHVGT